MDIEKMNLYKILNKKCSIDNVPSEEIERDVNIIFNKYREDLYLDDLTLENVDITCISEQIMLDLLARVNKDPTSITQSIVYYHSKAFLATFVYRVANYLICKYKNSMNSNIFSYHLSEYSSASTGIEIHYKARIGHSFVIDHGFNTVIGETAIIGDNCMLLNNIIIGASRVAFNQKKDRHPIIGDNVQIASGVKILGRIKIGNNVKIGTDCLITENIPDNTIIRLIKQQLQIKNVMQERNNDK